ncbi:MAG: hypothetical protein ACK4J0_03720, partial [Candidatus Anstonellaceae archaeon]
MKLKLTTAFAYLAGLTKFVNIKTRAIIIEGNQEILEIFIKHLIENNLVKSDKIICKKNKAYT